MTESSAIKLHEINEESQIITMLSNNSGGRLFRGQPYGPDGYGLLPAAWRKDKEVQLLSLANNYAEGYINIVDGGEEVDPVAKRCLGEMVAVDEFCTLVNSMGLYIPEVRPFLSNSEYPGSLLNYAQNLRELFLPSFFRIQNGLNSNGIPYVSLNTYICISLAQHHRIPTRFLDWTLNPIKGLFFAIDSFDEKAREGGAFPALVKFKNTHKANISTVNVVPYWTNDYLHRQEGVFTYTYPESCDDSLVSIEEKIERKTKNGDLNSEKFPILEIYKINPILLEKLKEIISYEKLKLQLMPAYSKCEKIIFGG